MIPPFDLSVPSDARYRSLAPDVAAKYAELAGCEAPAAQALGAEVDRAVTNLAPAGENIDVALKTNGDGLTITLHCGSRSAKIHRALSAK